MNFRPSGSVMTGKPAPALKSSAPGDTTGEDEGPGLSFEIDPVLA
jgi:hypothetical protein